MNHLKRTVILIMILATLFSLAACQSESKETASAKRVGVLMAPGAQEKLPTEKRSMQQKSNTPITKISLPL